MRMLERLLLAAALAAAAAPASAQFNFGNLSNLLDKAKTVVDAVKEPTEEEEIQIGQEFAATLVGAKPLDGDARLQRYVNTLGRWLALQTERPDLPWTFGVLDDPGFNAFATPGGHIFVTRGLINRMRSEAELAGVLAHEIGHVLKKHHLSAVKKNAWANILSEVGGKAIKMDDPRVKSYLVNFGRKLYASGLDQADEFEADRVGVVIAARAGFDAYGLPSVLQMLQAQSGQDGLFSLMFKTHPSPERRIEVLDGLMGGKFDKLPASTGKPVAARLEEIGK
ncbi:MAG TPA: M48 family metalloprotease [Paucimonas sp.]|nr:M48 family metalloprotease [Paucimonas sp.]